MDSLCQVQVNLLGLQSCVYTNTHTHTHTHTIQLQVIHKHNAPACFADRRPQGDINVKDYIMPRQEFYQYNVKITKSSYKYNNMDIMVNMMLTYTWLKFVDMPSFTVCVYIVYCLLFIYNSIDPAMYNNLWNIELVVYILTFNINSLGPEGSSPCAVCSVSCVGRCCSLCNVVCICWYK